MYRTQDFLPFAEHYYEKALDAVYCLTKKPETEEEKAMQTDSDGNINPIYSIEKGLIGYLEVNDDADMDDASDPENCVGVVFSLRKDDIHIDFSWQRSGRIKSALTAVVNDDTFVIRVFQYVADRKTPHRDGFTEVYRFCFNGRSMWAENRREIKPIKPGYFMKTNAYRRYVPLADKKKAEEDLLQVYHFFEGPRYLAKTDHVFSFLAEKIHPDRVFKYVPEEIRKDLDSPGVDSPVSLEPAKPFETSTTRKVKAEPFGKSGVLLRLFRDIQNCAFETERAYCLDGRFYFFVYDELAKRYVSTNRNTYLRCRLRPWGENMQYLPAEQGLKLGLIGFFNDIDYSSADNRYKKMNLSEFTGMSPKYLKTLKRATAYLADEFQDVILSGSCDADRIHKRFMDLREWFPDQTLRTKVIKAFRFTSRNLDWVVNYYKAAEKDYQPLIKSIIRIVEEKGPDDPDDPFGSNTADACLQEYMDYVRNREMVNAYLGDEVFKPFLKAGQIEKRHNKVMDYVRRIDEKEKAVIYDTVLKKIAQSEEYTENLDDSDNDFIVKGVSGCQSLYDEGRANGNCVGSYSSYMANQQCYIYFLRKKKEPQKTYYTMEVQDGVLRQCYGYRNSVDNNTSRKAFVKKWAQKHNIRIACNY